MYAIPVSPLDIPFVIEILFKNQKPNAPGVP
jgi:hypothetical protein